MSIVIALITVLIAAALIANFYPKPNKPILAEGEILTPDPIEESTPEVVEVVETPKVEAPKKMAAKPKKKPQHKKPTKKVDA